MRGAFVLFIAILGVLGCRRGASTREYDKVAEDLAVLSQSLDATLEGMGLDWLPDSALELRPIMASVGPKGASLSSGRDGPHYHLERVHPDAEGPTVTWAFTVMRGNDPAVEAAHVTIPRDRKMSMADFMAHAMKNYATQIARAPDDRNHHFTRIEFAFRFQDRAAVRALLVDSVARAPDLSEPRIALAMMGEDGFRELERWATDRPSYRKLTDAALAHRMRHHPEPAIRFMRDAMKLPMKEEAHQNLNASARAMPVAEMTLVEKRFDVTIEIASFMRASHEIDSYSKKRFELDWRALQAAATYRKGDHAGAVALVTDGLSEKEPFYQSDRDTRPRLATAIRTSDDAAVEAWRPNPGSDVADAFFCGVKLLDHLGLDAR